MFYYNHAIILPTTKEDQLCHLCSHHHTFTASHAEGGRLGVSSWPAGYLIPCVFFSQYSTLLPIGIHPTLPFLNYSTPPADFGLGICPFTFPVFASCTTPLCSFSFCRSPADLMGIACLHLHLLPSSKTHSGSCLQLLAAYILLLTGNLLSHLDWQKRGHLDRALPVTGSGSSAQCVWHTPISCLEPFCHSSSPCLYKALSIGDSSFLTFPL